MIFLALSIERKSAGYTRSNTEKRVDQRLESFLTDVLALAGVSLEAVREGAIALLNCEAIFRAQEANKHIRDRAAHAFRALCRARVVEEIQRPKGLGTAEAMRRPVTTSATTRDR